MPVNFYIEPTQLSGPDGELLTHKTRLRQGGIIAGQETVLFEITHLDGTFTSRYSIKELREALDILEPAPKKRDRKRPEKKKAKLGEALNRVISSPTEFKP